MSSIKRTAKRANQRKQNQTLTKKQARNLSKALHKLKLRPGNIVEDGKTLVDLIALFQITLEEDLINEYVKNQKFVVVSLGEPNPNPDIKVRDGVIYFPIFGLQTFCTIDTVGAMTTIYLIGTEDNKYLAVTSFMNFYDVEEQLKITGYYVAKEIAAYFNSLGPGNTVVPSVEFDESIGELNE